MLKESKGTERKEGEGGEEIEMGTEEKKHYQ